MRLASTGSRRVPPSESETSELADEIGEFLMREFGYRTNPIEKRWGGLALMVDRAGIGMYAKTVASFDRSSDLAFVIARIGFAKPGKRRGRRLVEFLLQILPKYGYSRVVLDQCNEGSAKFAAKLGFEPCHANPKSFFRPLGPSPIS